MPSLGQKVFGYIRQLSFIQADPREEVKPTNQCFVTKYLSAATTEPLQITNSIKQIYSGKQPNELPEIAIKENYETGASTIRYAITGPDEGLLFCRRSRAHLSAGGDIDFIDDKEDNVEIRHNPKRGYPRRMSNVSRKNESLSQSTTMNSLKPSDFKKTTDEENNETELIADVTHWNAPSTGDHAYGMAISLYEKNQITNEHAGNPIADCFAMIARRDNCVMALADGVNWGEKARLASCAAIQGSIEYLSRALFSSTNYAKSTQEVYVSLLRSFWAAQDFILEVNGHLTTLTIAVILPISDNDETNKNRYVVCSCNVGDSLGFVYSKKHGVREFTQGSHDILNNRDMRDALGALGPVDGNKPELSNLTLSMTIVEKGDIVFLTSDGVSDNFDPVVGKFAEIEKDDSEAPTFGPLPSQTPPSKELASKRQNRSASSINTRSRTAINSSTSSSTSSKLSSVSFNSADAPIRPPRSKKTNLNATLISNPMPLNEQLPIRPKYMRSKTLIEPRLSSSSRSSSKNSSPQICIKKSPAGLPIVTAYQRHALTLLRIADLMEFGINGTLRPCTTAKKLCSLLIDFSKMITSAKRKLLEQRELFYKISYDAHGQRKEVEMNRLQQRAARKRCIDTHFSNLPGKLDHASVVAWTVGSEDTNNNSDLLLDPIPKNTKNTTTFTLSTNPSNIYTETDF